MQNKEERELNEYIERKLNSVDKNAFKNIIWLLKETTKRNNKKKLK